MQQHSQELSLTRFIHSGGMKLLGSNEESGVDSGNSRPQIRTSQQDDAAVGYGFHPQQENLSEFPAAFVPKRGWAGTDDLVEVSSLFSDPFSQPHSNLYK